MKSVNPVVSVVMTSYADPAPRLKRAIDSILKQTFEDLELIIAFEPGDSNADAMQISCKDTRLIILKNAQRTGMVGSFNHCLSRAKGRYIARMDSDDYSYPDRIAKQIGFLGEHPDIAIVGGSMMIVDENEQALAIRSYAVDHHNIVRTFSLATGLAHPTVMWDRSHVGEYLRYDEGFPAAEDLELWLRLLSQGHRFANLEDRVIKYKQTADARRPIQTWRYNLKARMRHWRLALRYPPFAVGIVAHGIFALLPSGVVGQLTTRSLLSDRIRRITKTNASVVDNGR